MKNFGKFNFPINSGSFADGRTGGVSIIKNLGLIGLKSLTIKQFNQWKTESEDSYNYKFFTSN